MKLTRLFTLLVTAIGLGVTATFDDGASFSLFPGPAHSGRELRGGLDYMTVEYDDDGKCWIRYRAKNCDDVTIRLTDDVDVDNDKALVTCIEKKQKAEEGVGPPFKKDLRPRDATYDGEVVRAANVLWTTSKLEVKIKRFKNWKVTYDPSDDCHCRLEYQYDKKPTEIKFPNKKVNVNGNKVTCKLDDCDSRMPKGLKEIDYDLRLSRKEIDSAVGKAKGGNVKWERNKPIVVSLDVELKEIEEEDFEELDLTYDDLKGTVNLEYELDGVDDTLNFPSSNVDKNSKTGEVTFSKCEEPPDDVAIPWNIDFDPNDVKYFVRCDDDDPALEVKVKEAALTWEYDSSCDSRKGDSKDVGDGRRLRRRARARGNIKPRGRS